MLMTVPTPAHGPQGLSSSQHLCQRCKTFPALAPAQKRRLVWLSIKESRIRFSTDEVFQRL